MQCQPSLVTATHKDELWEMALERVTKTMDSHFVLCLTVLLLVLQFLTPILGELCRRGNDVEDEESDFVIHFDNEELRLQYITIVFTSAEF